jgi:pyruvate, orthophosphate dikinase
MAILVMQIARIGNGSTTLYSPEIVGAKAATLARVAALGIPVPPAFVLPVEFCHSIVNDGPDANRQLTEALAEGVRYLEDSTGRRLGDRRRPLLLSVRSGAAQSMPGMLDTVLDVGCTLAAVHGLIRMTGNPRFAWDCRRRFLESYGRVVLGIEATSFARPLAQLVSAEGVESERALDGEAVERLTGRHCQMIEDEYCAVPDDAVDQLNAATGAVYRSWTGERARTYRRLERLEHLRGTAVTIQTMVFGNRGLSLRLRSRAIPRRELRSRSSKSCSIPRVRTSYRGSAIPKGRRRSLGPPPPSRRSFVRRWHSSSESWRGPGRRVHD